MNCFSVIRSGGASISAHYLLDFWALEYGEDTVRVGVQRGIQIFIDEYIGELCCVW